MFVFNFCGAWSISAWPLWKEEENQPLCPMLVQTYLYCFPMSKPWEAEEALATVYYLWHSVAEQSLKAFAKYHQKCGYCYQILILSKWWHWFQKQSLIVGVSKHCIFVIIIRHKCRKQFSVFYLLPEYLTFMVNGLFMLFVICPFWARKAIAAGLSIKQVSL